jgi:hypothetical protein
MMARSHSRCCRIHREHGPDASKDPAPQHRTEPCISPAPPLPCRAPTDLAQYLTDASPLSPDQKRVLFTAVYLRAASSGNSDLLEWLVSLPLDPLLSSAENAANAKRFSLSRAQKRESHLSMTGSSAEGEVSVGSARLVGVDDDLQDWVARKWVDLDGRDQEGNPALVLAVAFGHAEAVRILVESGAHVNEADRGASSVSFWLLRLVTPRHAENPELNGTIAFTQPAGRPCTGQSRTTTSRSRPIS